MLLLPSIIILLTVSSSPSVIFTLIRASLLAEISLSTSTSASAYPSSSYCSLRLYAMSFSFCSEMTSPVERFIFSLRSSVENSSLPVISILSTRGCSSTSMIRYTSLPNFFSTYSLMSEKIPIFHNLFSASLVSSEGILISLPMFSPVKEIMVSDS